MGNKREAGEFRLVDPAMSLTEAAETLRLSLWTVRKWAADGRLTTIKLGSRRVVRTSEVERVLSNGVPPKLDPNRRC
jgi:excisionase family DNA binding protein